MKSSKKRGNSDVFPEKEDVITLREARTVPN